MGRCALEDSAALTGHPLAHGWQQRHGPLPPGVRLVPNVPFVLGGDHVVENLHPLPAVQGMQLRTELAVRLRDLPDGTRVRYRVVDG